MANTQRHQAEEFVNHAEALSAMDARQKACRYGHMGFAPLIWANGKPPKGFDAEPLLGGGILCTETCSVCTTKKQYTLGSDRMLENKSGAQYIYPDWWIHIANARELPGGNVTRRDCKQALVTENYAKIIAIASRKVSAA